jgi:hypothetical protein
MSKNNFKAPQKTLRTSWVSVAFSKPKTTGVIIKRSLSSNAKTIIKNRGQLTTLSQDYSY